MLIIYFLLYKEELTTANYFTKKNAILLFKLLYKDVKPRDFSLLLEVIFPLFALGFLLNSSYLLAYLLFRTRLRFFFIEGLSFSNRCNLIFSGHHSVIPTDYVAIMVKGQKCS